LHVSEVGFGFGQGILGLFHPTISDLGHLAEVAFPLGLCSVEFQLLDLLLRFVDLLHQSAFVLPTGFQSVALIA